MPPEETTTPTIEEQVKDLVKVENKQARLPKTKETQLVEQVFAAFKAKWELDRIEIQSDDDEQKVAATTKPLRDVKKSVEAIFKEAEKKYNEPLKALRDRKRSIVQEIDAALDTAKRKSSAWLAKREAELAAERQRAQAEAEKNQKAAIEQAAALAEQRGDTAQAAQIRQMPVQAPPMPVAGPQKAAGTRIAYEWGWEVLDFNSIPRRYLMIDESKLKAAIKQYGETISIPGLKITKTPVRKGSR